MRLVDHSAIFLLIAGTYTPICMLGVGGVLGTTLCAVIWIGALCGIAQTLFVSRKTVEMHLGNAYRKLGIHSREELPRVLAPAGSS